MNQMGEPIVPAQLNQTALDDLNEMTGGDPEFLAELIDTFANDGQTLLAEMRSALASGDAMALRRAAHTLKSNSRTFGATVLGDTSQTLEERAAGGQIGDVADLVARAEVEFPAVLAALNQVREAAND
jgi:HPt (histidine-containing phosphotransfer) domain-containing protein